MDGRKSSADSLETGRLLIWAAIKASNESEVTSQGCMPANDFGSSPPNNDASDRKAPMLILLRLSIHGDDDC